jgi:hypothetical protein
MILDLYFYARGAGVETILEKLLDSLLKLEDDLTSMEPMNGIRLDRYSLSSVLPYHWLLHTSDATHSVL